MDARCHIREATAADVPGIAALERICFPDPWTPGSLREALASAGTFGLVAEWGGGVGGYSLAREAGGSGEILNLAVAPEHRRRGLGRALLEEALTILGGQGCGSVFLEVRESNAAARELYERRGFRVVGVRRGYYRSPAEDGMVLRLDLPTSE